MNQKHIIRQETEQDYSEIYTLIQTAFSTAKVKDGDEQDYAVKLRNNINYIPQLALVVEADSKLIAHIMLTKIAISTPDGVFEALLLAPISVLLEYRDMGIGSMLIEDSFVKAKSLGYKAIFLCGDPAYYNRFGFKSTIAFGISNVNDIPQQYVLACELEPNALDKVKGTIDFF